jgi:hypothetical protein
MATHRKTKETKYPMLVSINQYLIKTKKRGIQRKEKTKEVKSKTSKEGCLHHYSKKLRSN